jgi:hypothetical protein
MHCIEYSVKHSSEETRMLKLFCRVTLTENCKWSLMKLRMKVDYWVLIDFQCWTTSFAFIFMWTPGMKWSAFNSLALWCVQSPIELVRGLAEGTYSLFNNTIYAFSNAATRMSKAAHKVHKRCLGTSTSICQPVPWVWKAWKITEIIMFAS